MNRTKTMDSFQKIGKEEMKNLKGGIWPPGTMRLLEEENSTPTTQIECPPNLLWIENGVQYCPRPN